MCVFECVCTYISLHLFIYIYINIHIYTHVYMYTYSYIHIHMHKEIPAIVFVVPLAGRYLEGANADDRRCLHA